MASPNMIMVVAALVTATPATLSERAAQKAPPHFPVLHISAPLTIPATPSPRLVRPSKAEDGLPRVEITGPQR